MTIFTFFFAVLVANFGFDSFAQKQKYTADIPTEKEAIRAHGFAEDWLCHIIMIYVCKMKSFLQKNKLCKKKNNNNNDICV